MKEIRRKWLRGNKYKMEFQVWEKSFRKETLDVSAN